MLSVPLPVVILGKLSACEPFPTPPPRVLFRRSWRLDPWPVGFFVLLIANLSCPQLDPRLDTHIRRVVLKFLLIYDATPMLPPIFQSFARR